MRKIKFRGKRKEDGKWIFGYLADEDYINNINEIAMPSEEVDPSTIGQFIGLRDRVRTDIYEGDLIEYCSGVDSFGAIWQTVRIEYRTNEGGYVGINQYRQTRDGREIVQNIVRCLNKCIVRGNIHDNPELLK